MVQVWVIVNQFTGEVRVLPAGAAGRAPIGWVGHFEDRPAEEIPPPSIPAEFQEDIDPKKPPLLFTTSIVKDPAIDELLPLLIILGHRRPEVKAFYDRIMKFIVNLAKVGRTSWIGNLMSLKLTVNVMERFGLIPLGVAASYDAGISWAVGVAAGTEIFSDIQIANIVETIVKGEAE